MLKYLRQDWAGRPVFEVSDAARVEKDGRWQEIHGWAIGDATVDHPDWLSLALWLEQNNIPRSYGPSSAPAWDIVCYTPADALAFAGSITRCPDRSQGVVLTC